MNAKKEKVVWPPKQINGKSWDQVIAEAEADDAAHAKALAAGDPDAIEAQQFGEDVAEALRRGIRDKTPTP